MASDKKPMQVKTYIVMIRNNVAKGNEPNTKVHSVWLTHRDAQDVVDAIPGTSLEKHLATKSPQASDA